MIFYWTDHYELYLIKCIDCRWWLFAAKSDQDFLTIKFPGILLNFYRQMAVERWHNNKADEKFGKGQKELFFFSCTWFIQDAITVPDYVSPCPSTLSNFILQKR